MRLFVLIFLLQTSPFASACLNSYHTTLDGHEESNLLDDGREIVDEIQEKARRLKPAEEESAARKRFAEDTPEERWMQESDVAVALLQQKKIAPAIEILERLTKEHPAEYNLAANLGTAYELGGRDKEALSWIKKGLGIDPQSHHGTEWLHVKILEAKLALQEDKNWLSTHSVLGVDFGRDDKPRWVNARDAETAGKMIEALRYQLRERLIFAKPPDPIVGDLLFDFSNLVALVNSVEGAQALLRFAMPFEPPKTELAHRRLAVYARLLMFSFSFETRLIIGLVSLVAAVFLLIFFGIRMVRRQK